MPPLTRASVATVCFGIALSSVTAIAQTPAPGTIPAPSTTMSVPKGYSVHNSIDLGGRIAANSGSDAMYSTLVNLQSGPRVQGETFELRALPGTKHTLVDSLSLFSTGFGGDPYLTTRLNFYKGKDYEFSGLFRRDRQYFDYDLLANPNIPGGGTIPIGPSTAPVGQFAWPQVLQSPLTFNTVRRMTDTNLTLLPLSKVTYRFGYSQNVMEGPTLSPSFEITGGETYLETALLQEYMRQSSDTWTGSVEWKPFSQTHVTFEEIVDHIKSDSYFTLAPSSLILQEADGTKVAVGNYTEEEPTISCNTGSMQNPNTILYPAQTPGGLPIIDPACNVASSYLRSQPTRFLYPTEMLRLQSSSIPHLTMTGDVRYTQANMNLPNYYENFQGLAGSVRDLTLTGSSSAKRDVFSVDYGMVWQVAKNFSLAEQVNYNLAHQPALLTWNGGQELTTPATKQTINYTGTLTAVNGGSIAGDTTGVAEPNYFGQKFFTNNLIASWDATPRTTFSFGWRHRAHDTTYNTSSASTSYTPITVSINENAGIFIAALRPASNWSVNGSVEGAYADDVLTAIAPRQTWHYKIRTMYKPRTWASISATYNDLERHNNTNNPTSGSKYFGPLNHVDHTRIFGIGTVLAPNEHYEFDLNYAYSDVYTATNSCYTSGATATLPGAATPTSSGAPNICPQSVRGSSPTQYEWYSRDFQNAPTNFGSASITLVPVKTVRAGLGYRISDVSGSRLYDNARDVAGSLNSTYQSPYVNLAWTFHPGWTWKAGYDFYGYGEGSPSGAEYCSTSSTSTSTIVPCASLPYPTGRTETTAGLTAPRVFHANNITLSMHYEF
ncbi:hypothetical protein [Terracidiphilus gabretensis]|uniref:hypothetical protein n=1 Tax=Terracidiphilus gabretensis TaxID=1577687 RepID=UPI0018D20A6F|nr:hypothetical protein [Terracidiphilus gabretensis]